MDKIEFFKRVYGSLAYVWSHGPVKSPLVILHGLGDSAILTYAPRFATTALRSTPSLFVDLPGFGRATATGNYPGTIERYADDVAALLQELGTKPCAVFGHSMGGNIAISMLHRHSELMGNLIVAEPLLNPSHSVLARNIQKTSEKEFVDRRCQMLIRATSLQAHRGDVAASVFLQTLQMAIPAIMHRAASSLLTARDPDFEDMLTSGTGKRVLLIGGRTEKDAAYLEAKGILVKRLPQAGHAMMVEQPARTAVTLLELLS